MGNKDNSKTQGPTRQKGLAAQTFQYPDFNYCTCSNQRIGDNYIQLDAEHV